MTQVYHYYASTKVYYNSTDAQTNPAGGYLVPANATLSAPPTIPSGQQAVYDENAGTWSLQAIPASSPSSSNPLPDFANMTIGQKLVHYGLGDLVPHLQRNTAIARSGDVNSKVAALQAQIDQLKTDLNAVSNANATVAANALLLSELTQDINAEGRLKLES
jgi:hypothetical protein